MVEYKKDSALTTVTPVLTDKIRGLDDPSGTPTSVTFLISALRTLIGENLDGVKINDTSDNNQYILGVSELTADRTITLPLLTGNDVFVFADFVQTLTNKRRQPRNVTVTVHATPTYNTDNGDIFRIGVTGDLLDLNITSMTTNLSGTPTHGEMIEFEFLDDGTPRTIAWGASFRSTDIGTLPTTTTASKLLKVLCQWDSADSKWDCVGVSNEA